MTTKSDISIGNLVKMIEAGELRLPEMQRQYVWTSSRVRDLLDSLYRGYPSGTILVWETDLEQPTRNLAISQEKSPFAGHKLLLDGQQRLTSLSAVIRGKPITVKNRQRPIDIAFNLDHPEGAPQEVIEVDEKNEPINTDNQDVYEDDDTDEAQSAISILEKLNTRVFTVASRGILAQPNWISVSEIFKNEKSDWDFLEKLVESPRDPNYKKYTDRLQRIRDIVKILM